MRNTGIRYSSKERMPTVLSEMAELLPPLSGEQLAVLEADLLVNGCYAPVIVNEDILRAIPAGQRTDAVCRMVCKAQEQDALLSAMRGLIREELRDIQCKSEQTKQGGDVDESVLGFLRALQEGDDMT